MDDKEYSEHDCFLRNVSNVRTTSNMPAQAKSSTNKLGHKVELQTILLTDESQKMIMSTLRDIYGSDFHLDDISKYKDWGRKIKQNYWEDRGTLFVQSVNNFSAKGAINDVGSNNMEDRIRRFALLKLENYGFHPTHCIEVYDQCKNDVGVSILLLYRKYMRLPDELPITAIGSDITAEDLLDMRNDEKAALKSIYDTDFEELELNCVWSIKFKIEYLLLHSPSEVRKAREAAKAAVKAKDTNKNMQRAVCRYFERNGTCRFGNKCRFSHVRAGSTKRNTEAPDSKEKSTSDEDQNEQWCFVEIRFPPGSKYPFEAPYIFVKTTYLDIPRETLLRQSYRLYTEACKFSKDGIPCVHSICELLQVEDPFNDALNSFDFPSSQNSILYTKIENDGKSNGNNALDELPTYYKRGQTYIGDNFHNDAIQTEKQNRRLLHQFLELQNDDNYLKLLEHRSSLPAFAKMNEILAAIEKSQVVVISGETGCGKSTQVPQFILDNWFFKTSSNDKKGATKMTHVEVICTQPRRLSAIGLAQRVATERIDRIGNVVGYQIRFENKVSQYTRLTFCTIGILLRRLEIDPELKSVTHLIVDEVHERAVESDFLLLILKRMLNRRTDIKVILMSATLNAKLFSDYFGGVPILEIPGRTYSVEQLFLEDILELSDFVMDYNSKFCRKTKKKEEEQLLREIEYADIQAENEAPPNETRDEKLNLAAIYARYANYSKQTCKSIYLMEPMIINPELIEAVLKYIVDGDHTWPKQGTILIFLPGLQDINNVYEALTDSSFFSPRVGQYVLIPLHSTISTDEQADIFRSVPAGKRKIILSTNIAETSVTIDDCVFVIDCGLMKEKHFDNNRNMESLEVHWISRANAQQRKGRAGRVMPGVCIHLFTSNRYYYNILSHPVPEIHRVSLEQLVLSIKTLRILNNISPIDVFAEILEPPVPENIINALARLRHVGALNKDEELTPLGRHLVVLPVDVRIGKLMLYGAIFQCLDSVLTIAACLSHKSPFVCPFNKRAEAERCKRQFAISNSDHLTCLKAYKMWLDASKRSSVASRNFANEHYLSQQNLDAISMIKYQFLELLISIGFVPIDIPPKRKNFKDNILELTGQELNINGENNKLLIALLYAALYPNIVKIMTPERLYIPTVGGAIAKLTNARDLRFRSKDGYVKIHPSSVNSNVITFQSPFLIYQEKIETSNVYIRDCSMLSAISLVLFAGINFEIELNNSDILIALESGWILLKAYNYETAEMIQCLRTELFKLLEEKINKPSLDLLNYQKGRKIIQNIVHLISNNN